MHQTIVGNEAIIQMEMAGDYPDILIGCTGGGSNFSGLVFPFLGKKFREKKDIRVIACEPKSCPSLTKGKFAYDFGDTGNFTPLVKMHTLGSSFMPPATHSGGLRYHGMAPMVSHLADIGAIEAKAYGQKECFEAGVKFANAEGIIPAPEATHAVKGAIDAGLNFGVEVIPGVELSTKSEDTDFHILGYLFDIDHEELNEKLRLFRKVREERAFKIVKKLRELGVFVDWERVKEIAGKGAVGRPHIARVLLEAGYIRSVKEAFEKYIGYNSPAYVPKYKMDPREAIALIIRAGGVPVMAHPGHYWKPEYFLSLKEYGLKGLEIWHPDHSPETVKMLEEFAEKYGFIKTGGSDFHGTVKKYKLGAVKVPYQSLRELRRVKREIYAQTD
jgi:predicted metal-dependent phosphoesterase TrpH